MACEEIICRSVQIETEEAQESLQKVDKGSGDLQKSFAGLDQQMSNMPAPLGKVRQAVMALNKAFKALLANPIIAIITGIVLALVALTKAFTKTEAGADKMNDIMAALSATIDVIVERAARLFKALGQIFQGNFKEGFQEMGDAVKGVGDEIREATQAAIAFEEATRALFVAETDVITANAERRQQIAELVFLTRDQTRSVEERRQAIIDADAIEKEILADNLRLQQMRVDLARQEIANTPELQRTREQTRKLAEEEGKLIDLQTESLTRQRELKNRLNELDNKAAADRKAEHQEYLKELEEKEKADEKYADFLRKQKKEIADDEFDIDKQLAEEQAAHEELMAEETEATRQEISDAAIASGERLAKAEEDRLQKQLENEQLLKSVRENIYQDSLTALVGFLGEGSKAAHAIQVADATREAIKGAISAYTGALALPAPIGPILAPIAAAAALAAGMANVRKMAQTGPTGGASVPSVSLASPRDTGPRDFANADVSIPGDVNIIQDRTTRRQTKAYVVQSEVTAAQDLAAQREDDVTL